jgi:hypothetical protein
VLNQVGVLENGFKVSINNHTKALELEILKLDEHSNLPVPNVGFEIWTYDSSSSKIASGTTNKAGELEFIFTTAEKFQIGKTYELRETAVPSNYIGLIDSIKFTVDINGDIELLDDPVSPYVSVSKKNVGETKITYGLNILNKPKGQLPATGGPGRKSSMFTAAAFIVFAIITTAYYVYRNRKGAK